MPTVAANFNHLSERFMKGDIDFSSATFKMMLLDSGYTLDLTDTQLGDVSANEITGTGYTAGGETLTTVTVSRSGAKTTFDADNIVWSTATFTCRFGVIYASGTFGGLVNPIVSYVLFDDTPADVSVTGQDFTVQIGANGIGYIDNA